LATGDQNLAQDLYESIPDLLSVTRALAIDIQVDQDMDDQFKLSIQE
jgi:hypothetical protein